MRSIKYMLGGNPGCFADCIDYLQDHEVKEVKLELKTVSHVTEQIIMKRLLGYFTWSFSDFVITYEEQFGGVIETEKIERQQISLANANRRLERRLKDFNQFDIKLTGDNFRFS